MSAPARGLDRGPTLTGFTLIELLVVIAIIGILASIVLVSLNSARSKGRDTRIISDVRQVRTELEAEALISGAYAVGSSNCVTALGSTATLNSTAGSICKQLSDDVASNSSNGSVLTVKTNPTSGSSFGSFAVYALLNTGQYFCMDNLGKALQLSSASSITAPTGNSGGCQ